MRAFSYLASTAALFSYATGELKGTAKTCCDALSNDLILNGKIYLPGSRAYEARLETYFDANAALRAWCMVLPRSTEDASHVMKIISKYQCPFGIKSGGHGTHKLSNAVQDGITIDLGYMNATKYLPEREIVSVQPAGISAHVYESLERYGVAITGGRVAPVGLGGFVTGGGISYHASAHGWGCDNVKNFEVVLANGDIVNANERQNPDLWVALRGGSGNYGLVTRFDMKAIRLSDPLKPNIVGGIIVYDLNKDKEVVEAYTTFAENVPQDPNTSAVIWWLYTRTVGRFSLSGLFANVANVGNPPALKDFLEIDDIQSNTIRSATIANITYELAEGNGKYNIWFTSTFKNNPRVIHYANAKYQELTRDLERVIPPGNYLRTQVQFQPITKSMVEQSKGNNIMGLESRIVTGAGQMHLIYIGVSTAADQSAALPLVRAYHDDVNQYASSFGLNWNWIYLDYANGEQDPLSTFGEAQIRKMKKASAKYDPNGVFQKLRGSGFKIPA